MRPFPKTGNTFRIQSALWILLLVILVGQPYLPGQSRTPPGKRASFEQEVSVVLKLIQVYVLDKKGEPVTDLTKEDFVLHDNGEPQTITDFENHLPPPRTVDEKILQTAAGPATRLSRRFFFLLDLSQNDMRGLKASKKAALTFLRAQTLPTDEIAVLTYSHSRGLILREYLTNRHETVARRIESIKTAPGIGMDAEYEEDALEGEDMGPGYENLLPVVNPTKDRLMRKTADFADTLKELSRALRGVSGFKNIILFSAGINRELLEDIEDSQVREGFDDALRELGSSGCPVFTVDTNIVKDEAPNKRGDGSLRQMARLSGGRYFPNAERAEAVARSIDRITGHYYVLGYYIKDAWDGRFHRIEVKVGRPDCRAATADGFFNPKPYPDWSDFERKTHRLDLAVSETTSLATPAALPASAYSPLGPGPGSVLFVTEIREDALPGFESPRAGMTSLVLDGTNTVVGSVQGELPLAFSEGPDLYAYTVSTLPPGDYRYRLVLVDPATGASARADLPFTVGELREDGIRLSTPFLFTAKEKVSYARIPGAGGGEKSGTNQAGAGLKDMLPFINNQAGPVVLSLERTEKRLFAMVHCAASGEKQPSLEFAAAFVSKESGTISPLALLVKDVKRLEGRDVLLMEISFPVVRPGAYSFRLTAEDKNNGTRAVMTKDLTVR